jgi:hypothetical protein
MNEAYWWPRPPSSGRWTASLKAAVVRAVGRGIIPLNLALIYYTVSLDEFAEWQKLYGRYGARGLRTTRLQEYRQK